MSDPDYYARGDRKVSPSLDAGRAAVALTMVIAPLIAFPWQKIRAGMLDGGEDATARLPELLHSARMFASGQLAWTPDLWMGHPLLGDPSFAMLYPPRLLLLLGSPVAAYGVYVLLHFLLAELTAYAYLKAIGVARLGSLFGALGYAYAGFMLGPSNQPAALAAGAWAPLVLLMFELAGRRNDRATHALSALVFALLPFAGALQLTLYLAATLLVLGAARAYFERRWSLFASTVVTLIPGLLVSAAQLLPALSHFRQIAPSYDESGALSFHPLLFPTFFLPHNQSHSELASRAGVLLLCASCVAIAGWRSASALIRGWIVVAGLSLLLVLTGPVHHNFELALALSVLGAFGFEQARRSGSLHVRRWLVGGLAVALLTASAVWLGAGIPDRAGGVLLQDIGWLAALGAVLFFALWVRAIGGPSVPSALWLAVAVGPVLEAAWAARNPAARARDFRALADSAKAVLPASRPIRVLSVPAARGNLDALVGNSGLFHAGVQAINGHSARASPDVRTILNLSAQGQPNAHADLAWSLLPSLYSVTHLVLPSIECGSPRLRLGASERCATDSDTLPASPARFECTGRLPGAGYRARLETELRAPSKATPGIALGFYDSHLSPPHDKVFELFVSGNALSPEFAAHSKAVNLTPINPIVNFMVKNEGGVPLALRHTRLVAERESTLADLVSADSTLKNASIESAILTLSASREDEAKAERRFVWPRSAAAATAVLELEARALPDGEAGQLVIDLYDESGFDPESGQLVVLAKDLGQEFKLFSKPIAVSEPPEKLWLRVFAEGGAKAAVRRARLMESSQRLLSGFPVTRGPLQDKLVMNGDVVELAARGWVAGRLHLPVRPLEVRLTAVPSPPARAGIDFGFHASGMPLDDFQRRHVEPDELSERPLKKTVLIAPDAREGTLFVRGSEALGLRVKSLEVVDACAVRRYENPRPLAYGLGLYENPRALPRAYTVALVITARDLEAARRSLLALDETELGSVAVLDTPVPLLPLSVGEVESMSFGPTTSEVVVKSDEGPTVLVVNERYAPEWTASIDGAPAPILRANGIVRAVVVPQGKHHVRFSYVVPTTVWWGAACAAIGLLLAAFAAPALQRAIRSS